MSTGRAIGRTQVPRTIRIGHVTARFRGDPALVERALGPLAALEERSVARTADLVVEVSPAAQSAPLPAAGTAPEVAVAFETADGESRVRAPGIGSATWRAAGGLSIELDPAAPEGDAVAERLTIPALAEYLRHSGVYLIHAAILRMPSPATGVVVVPASRGGGKSTLSLSLRRHGWILLSDDRGWLTGDPTRAEIDPWPEAPRVGDRSLFLLPPYAAPGLRDERTGKAPVFGLTPPRVDQLFSVVGVLLPRLVEGPGGGVRPARGADALAAVVSQMVVATVPETTHAAFDFAVAMTGRMRAFIVEVGDDPATLARNVAAAFQLATPPESAAGSTSGDRA